MLAEPDVMIASSVRELNCRRAQRRDAILVAIDVLDKGLYFANSLHLARSSRASGFATFDQRPVRRAQALALALQPVGVWAR